VWNARGLGVKKLWELGQRFFICSFRKGDLIIKQAQRGQVGVSCH
jgi:hypothetical protein